MKRTRILSSSEISYIDIYRPEITKIPINIKSTFEENSNGIKDHDVEYKYPNEPTFKNFYNLFSRKEYVKIIEYRNKDMMNCTITLEYKGEIHEISKFSFKKADLTYLKDIMNPVGEFVSLGRFIDIWTEDLDYPQFFHLDDILRRVKIVVGLNDSTSKIFLTEIVCYSEIYIKYKSGEDLTVTFKSEEELNEFLENSSLEKFLKSGVNIDNPY